MTHPLERALSDDVLRESFDPQSLARGRDYWAHRAVRELELSHREDDTYLARAVVSGSRRTPYVVGIDADDHPADPMLFSFCTCPVASQCKHGAATALALRDHFRHAAPPVSRWRHDLQLVVDELARLPRPRDGSAPLALEVGLFEPGTSRWSASTFPPAVTLRPLRRGAKKQRWVKTGAAWSDLPRAAAEGRFDRGHLDALLSLYGALSTTGRYWSSQRIPFLADFGPTVWRLLTQAVDAGVELVTAAPLIDVEVVADGVDLGADLVAEGDDTRMTLAVHHGERPYAGSQLILIGNPAHGVSLLADEHVVLAPLRRPAPASLIRLATVAEPIRIPSAERADLEAELLPALVRQLPVSSSDGSVVIPEPVGPRLALRVTWHDASRADLLWRWRYSDRHLPFVGDNDPHRDPAAEAELLASMRASDPLDVVGTVEHVIGAAVLRLALETVPALREAGVEVEELRRPDFRAAEGDPEIRFDVRESEEDSPTDWLDLDVTIRVDGEAVPLPEVLAALTRGDDQIVLPSGLYVRTDRPELRRLAELVRAAAELREAGEDGLSVGTHDLGVWAELAELGVVDAQAAAWVRRAQALRDLTSLPDPEPVGVVTELRHYQRDGFRWLAFLWEHRLGGILADDMGLGKTLQVLAMVSHAHAQGAGPFLVVAPSSVVSAWTRECERHTPHLRTAAVTASESRRGASVATLAAEADVVLTTYTLLRLEQEQYAEVEWAGMVLDEAQQVKNHRGKTYAAVRKVTAEIKIVVTGTPFENRLMELWALLSIACPGLYPWPATFAEQVVRPVEKGGDAAALERLRRRIRPFVLRRTKDLVAKDLPPKQEQVVDVELGPRHRRLYDTHLQKERQRILGLIADDFDRNRIAIFSALTTLRQLALDPALVDHDHHRIGSAKLDLLVDHLTEVTAEGHRALVFSQFTSFLGRARERLTGAGIDTAYLDGSTRDRGAVIEEFRSGGAPVFLISLKAGGVGLTLTEADYVFVLDPWWNPATEAQAVDRAHRIGQDKPVMVYRLVASDTIEEKVMALKARKAKLFATVLDGDGLMNSALAADDIRGLLD